MNVHEIRTPEKPTFYRIVIIPLEKDLKDTLYYKLKMMSGTIEPGSIDMIPFEILEMAKDPISAILEIYVILKQLLDEGIFAILDQEEPTSDTKIFEEAGREMSEILECISQAYRGFEEELNHYNIARTIHKGIVFGYVEDLESADLL